MDSPSWKDAISAAIGSCLPCFRFSTDSDNDPLQNPLSRSRVPQHLEALLADPQDTDTEAETVSLHSNLGSGSGSGTPRTRKNKNKKNQRTGQGITLFGLNLFGRRTGPIHLPEDEDEVDRFLIRSSSRRIRSTSSSSSTTPAGGIMTRSSSLTFDPDAAPLDPASIDRLTPAQLEERALQAQLQAEEERQAKEERKRIRREKKELKKLAAQLAVGGPVDDEGFQGFQGSGAFGVGVGTNSGYPFIPAPLLSPDTMASQSIDDEADGSADLDGTLYTSRSRAGGASVSGGGSDSQRSPASGSAASYQQYPNEVNLTPSTTPATKKKKKSSSSKSKSSRSHSSATSSIQSPSLASPVGSVTGLRSPSPLGNRLPQKPTLVMTDSYSVEDRGFPSPAIGGPTRVGRNGAFLASRGDEA